jgi:hypothetical protein
MSKQVITKIAIDEINELLSKVELIPQEAREILYKGAYIRLFDTNIFKGEEGKKEIQVKYYRIFSDKVFYFRTFIYNFPNVGQRKLGDYYYDYPEVSYQLIRPSMDLENLLKDFQELEG